MALHPVTLRQIGRQAAVPGERIVRLELDQADWCLRESWQSHLFGSGAPDWFALEGAERAEQFKRGRSRTTWRVESKGRAVFAKVIDPGGLVDQVKTRLLGSVAEREWRASYEAELRAVPAVRGVAVGRRTGSTPRSVFLSEGIEGAVSLAVFWERQVAATAGRDRRGLLAPVIESVAVLFAVAHENGFVHRDAHPDNILLSEQPAGARRAVLADVHAAHIARGPVGMRRSARSLAQLQHYFRRLATRTEQVRFLRRYLFHRRSLGAERQGRAALRAWLGRMSLAGGGHAARLTRQRNRRLRRNGKYFSTTRLEDGWTATVVLRLERRHVFAESEVPDRTDAEWRAILNPVLASFGVSGYTEERIDLSGLRIEVTRLAGLIERLNATLAWSAHRKEFARCHRIRHEDVPTPLVLGYGEHRRRGLVDKTVLIRPKRG